MLAQHLTEYFEECPSCGKDGLKRSHASLYEINGVLHICKTIPLKHQQLTWNKGDGGIYQDEAYQDEELQCGWSGMGSETRGNDYGTWYYGAN